jgi:hypothetical protein
MKTEIVNNSELNKFFVKIGWEPVAETEKCFVDEDGRRVSYQYLEDHYGEATEENAAKHFAMRKAEEPAEEAEHLYLENI